VIILRDGEFDATSTEASIVTIGVFDGLHRGHQAVIAQLNALANELGAVSTVVTFDPTPAMVLAPTRAPLLLATLDQRLEGFEALGVQQVRVLTFDATLASESARHFIERVLVGELRTKGVVVARTFTLVTIERVPSQHCARSARRWVFVSGRHRFTAKVGAGARPWFDRRLLVETLKPSGMYSGAPSFFEERSCMVTNVERRWLSDRQFGGGDTSAIARRSVYAGATIRERTWWPAAISWVRVRSFTITANWSSKCTCSDLRVISTIRCSRWSSRRVSAIRRPFRAWTS